MDFPRMICRAEYRNDFGIMCYRLAQPPLFPVKVLSGQRMHYVDMR